MSKTPPKKAAYMLAYRKAGKGDMRSSWECYRRTGFLNISGQPYNPMRIKKDAREWEQYLEGQLK